jgi:hypothetical protein
MPYIEQNDSVVNEIILEDQENVKLKTISTLNILKRDMKRSYQLAVETAARRTVSGSSLDKEIRRMTKVFTNPKIPVVTSTGKVQKWDNKAYFTRATRNVVKENAISSSIGRMEEIGTNLIEMSSHFDDRVRDNCLQAQGKIYDLNGGSGLVELLDGSIVEYYDWGSIGFGNADGPGGTNCRHQFYPVAYKRIIS